MSILNKKGSILIIVLAMMFVVVSLSSIVLLTGSVISNRILLLDDYNKHDRDVCESAYQYAFYGNSDRYDVYRDDIDIYVNDGVNTYHYKMDGINLYLVLRRYEKHGNE